MIQADYKINIKTIKSRSPYTNICKIHRTICNIKPAFKVQDMVFNTKKYKEWRFHSDLLLCFNTPILIYLFTFLFRVSSCFHGMCHRQV